MKEIYRRRRSMRNLCEQVFVNLVQNAYDAMSETGGTAAHFDWRRGQEAIGEASRCKSRIRGREFLPSFASKSSIPFSPPRKRAWAWGFPSFRKLWTNIAALIELVSGPTAGNPGEAKPLKAPLWGTPLSATPLRETERSDGQSGACFVIFLPLAEQPRFPRRKWLRMSSSWRRSGTVKSDRSRGMTA